MFVYTTLNAQLETEKVESSTFQRKGRILVELDYGNLLFSSGANLSVTAGGNYNETEIAFNGGYFFGENFALTIGLNLYDASFSSNALSIGIKQYIAARFPIDLNIGNYSVFDDSYFYGTAHLAYSLLLADNISLEPGIGIYYLDKSTRFNGKINFSIFL